MKRTLFLITAFLGLIIWSCEQDLPRKTFLEDEELTIYEYLEAHSGDYSMLINLIDKADYDGAFRAYGSYTFFAFKDSSFDAYLKERGMNSVDDMSKEEARVLVRNHAFSSEITSSNLGTGKLPEPNLLGDQVVSHFTESGLQGIVVNRESKIIERDIQLSNGVMHVLDKPLKPIVQSVAERLEDRSEYSIFVKALKQTGLYSTLDNVYDTTGADEVKRNNFTVFAESNAIYKENDISSYQDLLNHVTDSIMDPTNPESGIHRFVANHIIADKSLFIKDFDEGNYQAFNDQLLNFKIDQTFKINSHMKDGEEEYISFLMDGVDVQAKNGVFHSIDDLLVVFHPDPVEVIWEFTDQPVVRDLEPAEGEWSDSKHFTTLQPFPNMHGSISGGVWRKFATGWSDYGFMSDESLNFGAPDWDVTFHMPIKIVKGRYKMYVASKTGDGRATVQLLVNDLPIGEPIDLNEGPIAWYNHEHYVGEVTFRQTKQNDIRIITVESGQGQMDYVKFVPVN